VTKLHAFVYVVIDQDGAPVDNEPTTETLDVEHADPDAAAHALVAWLRGLADGVERAVGANRG